MLNRLEKRKEVRTYFLLLLVLILIPIISFYLMQFVFGGDPWIYSPKVIAGNAICIAAIYYILTGIIGQISWSAILTLILAVILGIANYFVHIFRGNPILPWDLTAIGTALAVSETYQLTITWRMMLAIVLILVLSVVLFRMRKKLKIAGRKGRVLCLVLGLLCLQPMLQPQILEKFGIKTDVWDQAKAYREDGIIGVFFCNTRFMEVEVPQGYSEKRAEQLLQDSETEQEQMFQAFSRPEMTKKPNIIAIMNESWADFEAFGNLQLNRSPMEFMHQMDAITGKAYASVFGAGTSASEFEFLTGNSMAFLPSGSIPYQQYILEPTDSVVSLLKENGYECKAFHPGENTSWQRNKAYPLLGFDEFKSGEEMNVSVTEEHGYVSDVSNFNQVIYEYEHRDKSKPFFLFNVTIQNHGSYTYENYPAEIYPEDEPGKYPKAEQYLTLLGKTDQAFEDMIHYFEQQEEPVLIVMFGDHQPAVEQEFLDKAYGVKQEDMTMEEYMGKFQVPFLIWANYGLPEYGPEQTSLNFLSQYMLEYAGIEKDPYSDFLTSFQETIPALTFAGYFDTEGNAYSHLETNMYTSRINDYNIVQYKKMFN